MSVTERKYLVKTVEGEELGPADQDQLKKWVETGRITPVCQVRCTLLKRWEKARDITFLKELFDARQPPKKDLPVGPFGHVLQRITLRAARVEMRSGLQRNKPVEYEAAPVMLRLLAGVSDLLIMLFLAIVIYLAMAGLYVGGTVDSTSAFYLGLAIFYPCFLLYYTGTISSRSQTPGHKLWGLMVVHKKGDELFLFRCFWFTLFMLMFGITTPFVMFVLPSGGALQDVFSGVRVVKTKIVGEAR
ncbi:MAG: hypothetical protein A3K19_29065 [Lentisphaerae bacterium RIFOXYB12_FULL_65_16]|nr:MAG: hypothetical protein A3K18_04455 [Lentisphaerae bacterium RIFOXYA12_64_32]OGV88349.1 MAG: hypothetical protein A3K19_29065 [Lentisphaerae bacterium RIFOXYB12_FULL_65_16]